ncbi:MAG: DPP IV N-terminal domain-containing protein [Pirellulales bacterium]
MLRSLVFLSIVFLVLGLGNASGIEPPNRARMLDESEDRLKAIYDRREFAPAVFIGKWAGDSASYYSLEKIGDGPETALIQTAVPSLERRVIIDRDQLTIPGSTDRLIIQDFGASPRGDRFLLQAKTSADETLRYWMFDVKAGSLRRLEPDVSRLSMTRTFSPTGDRIVCGIGSDLFVIDSKDGHELRLTTDGSDTIRNGVPTSWTPEGRQIQADWSPDGKQIVYVQSDFSQVRIRPVIHPTDPTYPDVSMERYARVGTPIASLRVGVVAATGGDTHWFELPFENGTFYINDVTWVNDSELLVEQLSRFRDARTFLLLNVKSGAVSPLYNETNEAWVDASYAANAGVEWIRDQQQAVLLSERSGQRQAWSVARQEGEPTAITQWEHEVISRGPADEANGLCYFLASPNNATQKYLFSAPLDGSSEPQRVTPLGQSGSHEYTFSPDRKWAFHRASTFDSPPTVELISLPKHETIRVLEDNAECRRRAAQWIARPTEFLKLDIGNGVVMDAWMIKPREFDASKKYPLFVFVYGERHAQTVLDDWAGGQNHTMFHRMIADLGYIVVSMDGRGTPAPKGAAWRRAVYGSLGPLSTEEQAAGVLELGRMRSYVDLSRVGIWGWSGGGSNTLNAMFRRPDVYHVGIAVAPKPQPELYNAWFQEIFMRTLELNPEGYRKAGAIHFAEGLRGDLLIIHGTGETNTHLQIVEGLVDRLIELGKKFDYMAYPNRDHGLREGKGTAVHMRLLMTRYLIEHLPPGPK